MKFKITSFKKIWMLVAISLFALGLVAPTFLASTQIAPAYAHIGGEVLVESQVAAVTGNSSVRALHPSVAGGTISAISQSINGSNDYLTAFEVNLINFAMPVGTLKSALYSHMGTYGTSSLPYVLIEESTTTINTATQLNNLTYTLVTFEYSGTTLLEENEKYVLIWWVDSATTVSASHYIKSGYCASGTGSGNFAGFVDGAWVATSGSDIVYYIYGTPYQVETTYDFTTNPSLEQFMAFMVPLVVLLLPAILLMFLTRRTDKWLLIIGIAIGAGLGYYFGMVPLWLVFLVVIGLIGMAYQSVRGGGAE